MDECTFFPRVNNNRSSALSSLSPKRMIAAPGDYESSTTEVNFMIGSSTIQQ